MVVSEAKRNVLCAKTSVSLPTDTVPVKLLTFSFEHKISVRTPLDRDSLSPRGWPLGIDPIVRLAVFSPPGCSTSSVCRHSPPLR